MDEITLRWIMLGLLVLLFVGFKLLANWAQARGQVDTCPKCHGRIPKKAYRCPRCGWSQDTTDSGEPGIRIPG